MQEARNLALTKEPRVLLRRHGEHRDFKFMMRSSAGDFMRRWVISVLALVCVLAAGCRAAPVSEADAVRQITVLYTNDEHGWMAATDDSGGAAGMLGLWRDEEGYTEDGPFLVLSGGDTWTGPAISSWFDGESMVEVMNAMGYDAAAIGNHEFDFGVDGLRARIDQAAFPFLSANIHDAVTGEPADFALPYVIQEVGGVRVGIIGLSSLETPETTMPTHVSGLEFVPYKAALEVAVSQVRADGAEVILVVSHLCSYEMLALAPVAADLDIAMIGGGHCHESFNQTVDGVVLVEARSNLKAYARVDLFFDTGSGTVTDTESKIVKNVDGTPDADLAGVVAKWQAEIDDALLHVIGYTDREIGRRTAAMFNLVTDAWLAAYPADIAMTNTGGFRQSLPAGEITLADVVGVLPFDNTLVDVEMTGAQVVASYEHGRPAIAGMTARGGYKLSDGTPIDRDATYHVLVNDFMYAGGDGFRFNEYDPDAYFTGIDWRQPVIDWIIEQKSSAESPLDAVLDSKVR